MLVLYAVNKVHPKIFATFTHLHAVPNLNGLYFYGTQNIFLKLFLFIQTELEPFDIFKNTFYVPAKSYRFGTARWRQHFLFWVNFPFKWNATSNSPDTVYERTTS